MSMQRFIDHVWLAASSQMMGKSEHKSRHGFNIEKKQATLTRTDPVMCLLYTHRTISSRIPLPSPDSLTKPSLEVASGEFPMRGE